jgi:spore maturation protein CgeB
MFKPENVRVLIDFPIYGGSLTTARYAQNAFRKLGYQTKIVDNSICGSLFDEIKNVKDKARSEIIKRKLLNLLSNLYWEEFMQFKPHLAFFIAQSPISADFIKKIRRTSTTSVFWFVEDYRRFSYWAQYAPLFDIFFTIQKGKFFEQLDRIGTSNFAYVPLAADESVAQGNLNLTEEDRRKFGSDVSFMGAGYPNRHSLFSQLLDYDLKIWGTGWENNSTLEDVVQSNGERVSVRDTVKIYNATKININLHSSLNSSYFEADGDFVNPRTFEIMASGGFQLVDRRMLLPELFVEGKDIITFNSLDDLREKIDYYLRHEMERIRIAKNGQREVLKSHTYKNRIEQMIDIIQKKVPKFANSML